MSVESGDPCGGLGAAAALRGEHAASREANPVQGPASAPDVASTQRDEPAGEGDARQGGDWTPPENGPTDNGPTENGPPQSKDPSGARGGRLDLSG
jgi:hypothetical protein